MVVCVSTVGAHEFTTTQADLRISGSQFQLQLVCDLDALALGVSPSTDAESILQAFREMDDQQRLAAWQRVEQFLIRRIRLRFDGQDALFDVARLPSVETLQSYFGTQVVLRGSVPTDWSEVIVKASRALPPLQLSVICDGRIAWRGLVAQGVESPAVKRAGGPVFVMRNYLVLGFLHIIPRGLDHILFVLGLFLLTPKPRQLLWQVSVFTLAHTVTLGLAVFELVRLPSIWVEIAIALSLVYVGTENLLTKRLNKRRLFLVFGFGLLHGMGFAGILLDRWIPNAERLPGLISFNVGVELGQLAVLVAAWLLTLPIRRRPHQQKTLVVLGSILIAVAGAWMLVQRILEGIA